MAERKAIAAVDETAVLTLCARRCALCVGLRADLAEKKGQIAHIDQDPSNNKLDNLIFLCIDCHDTYDSTTRQSKGITAGEVREYRSRLHNTIATSLAMLPRLEAELAAVRQREEHLSQERIVHDREVFARAKSLMTEQQLVSVLDQLQADDSYTRQGIAPIDHFYRFFGEVGNSYVIDDLDVANNRLREKLSELRGFISIHFFVYPLHFMTENDCQYCLYPELSVDRAGKGRTGDSARYNEFTVQLDERCRAVREAYLQYRRLIKQVLLR